MSTQTESATMFQKAVWSAKVIPIALLLSLGIFAALQPFVGDVGAIVGFFVGCYLTRFYFPAP
jgi:hypothetical protein